MSHLTESAIQVLERQGYTFIHGSELAPDGNTPERQPYANNCQGVGSGD